MRDHKIDPKKSYFVGDKGIDILCGQNAGIKTILVQTGYAGKDTDCKPDFKIKTIAQLPNILKR